MIFHNYWPDPKATSLPAVSAGNGTVTRVDTSRNGLYGFNLMGSDADGCQTRFIINEWATATPSTSLVMVSNVYRSSTTAIRSGYSMIVGTSATDGKWTQLGADGGIPKKGTTQLVVPFTLPSSGTTQVVFTSPLTVGEAASYTNLMLMTAADWTAWQAWTDNPGRLYGDLMPLT
ncbi:hypothetical protein JS533_001750 [Bifidobacterium amazonense]|uniref:Uncharacterized protein n=1 Tax=Bifidobacterium amazonense TaxID=2809027 RepID=A0ABS9VSF5_9BIFI|nr:hypothetical protein [Bifidobacterium amazonense]MCH9275013.1 hypothetical protein [Bifidobacterium amazonense]